MKNWRDILVDSSTSVKKTLEVINRSSAQISLVVDKNLRLLGTVTDGDIRRGILGGVGLEAEVSRVMFTKPKTAAASDLSEEVLERMKQLQIRQMPILDDSGVVIGLHILDDLIAPKELNNWVVLMAGGMGKRMLPLTDNCPKPMLKVGGKPVLEIILTQLSQSGFRKFFISVNYMADMIESHFGDGSKWGVEIHYLREKEKLGTAGALGLLPSTPDLPLLVMNGDLLTKLNMRQLLDFHEAHNAELTMGVREYDFQVPYGVVRLDENKVTNIDEKPIQKFFVNAGIYVLGPSVLKFIPKGEHIDMTAVMDKLIAIKRSVSAFPIQEYWLDIGRLSDFERANGEFFVEFGE
jgi:dTDP-glucose pyrophosphorylase